jgi:ornithine cyclodeaminase/alanine dehydrogenase-like protein (mu-crystallin family)
MAIWLGEADVRAMLSMPDLIDAMQCALTAFSTNQVNQPVRTVIETPSGFFASMPAHVATPAALGAKLVTVFDGNARQGLPTHLATIALLDPNTGELLAVMDGRFITEARTAAVSAVAVRSLALEKTPVLAIIGSGVQARSHLEALALMREFADIRCWSPTRGNLEKLVSESNRWPIRAMASAKAAIESADVVVLVTASSTPVIEDAWVKPGACVVSVGACRPYQREMDPKLVARGRLVVDSRAAALQESGDVVQGIREHSFGEEHIAAELGQVLAGAQPGRIAADQAVVFKSLGLAVEDVAAAGLVYRRALQLGKGLTLA